MNESCHKYEWVVSYRGVMSRTGSFCGMLHINESCHMYERVMSHKRMSHGTHMNEPCQAYEWVMPHVWQSHVTQINESWHTYEWAMSHIWRYYITPIHESCHTQVEHVLRDVKYLLIRGVFQAVLAGGAYVDPHTLGEQGRNVRIHEYLCICTRVRIYIWCLRRSAHSRRAR